MLTQVYANSALSVYKLNKTDNPLIKSYIVTSIATREICNDPQICGVEYTQKLQSVCKDVLSGLSSFTDLKLTEHEGIVINILQSGLIFGLRDALSEAFSWNIHSTSFIYKDKKINESESELHLVTDSENHKLSLPTSAQIFIGDIIHSGNTLKKVLELLVKYSKEENKQINHIVLFAIGTDKTDTVITAISDSCSKMFDNFSGIDIFYIEGQFMLSEKKFLEHSFEKKCLTKKGALLAPEFISSQYELPFYPIEPCVIYDAEDRAFNLALYIEKVVGFWETIRDLASKGYTYEKLIKECFPEIDASKFGKQNLMSLAEQHITKLKRTLQPKNNIE